MAVLKNDTLWTLTRTDTKLFWHAAVKRASNIHEYETARVKCCLNYLLAKSSYFIMLPDLFGLIFAKNEVSISLRCQGPLTRQKSQAPTK